jgi:K+-sensing histidine kinase KdpD
MKSRIPSTNAFEDARDAMHRQMLSAVSHDLKTPLATIIGSLEIYTRMDARLTPEKKTMLIQSALGEAYRLDNFVTNILDMAKLEGNMVKTRTEKIDVAVVIKDTITKLGPKAEQSNIKISHQPGMIANTDPTLLGRALGILIDNAIKHAGKRSNITIECMKDERDLTIAVRDDGDGIPPAKLDEIFLKHTRFAKSDQQNAGTGLGLAICKQIMALISGSVTVKNIPTGGAEFMLRLSSA